MEWAAFYANFEETFCAVLPRYFSDGEQTAMSLTGGLDSRMIMACLKKRPGEVPCYTFGGMGRETYNVPDWSSSGGGMWSTL